MPPRRSTGSPPKTKMTINWRVPNGNSSNDEYEKLDEEVIKRASEGSMLDLILLATNVKFVPSTHRKDAFSLFLAFLRDTETMFDGCEPMQAVLAGILLKVLLGVGQSSLWVEYGKSMAQELAENWKTVTRWVCRFCDKFNSVTEPFPGAPISYADWYCSLASALFIAHAEPNRAREFWSVPDARKGLFRLWLLDGPDLPSHVVKMCASVVGIVILHQYCVNMDPASELVKVSGLDEDGVAHLCMTRMIKAAKRGNVDDIRDNAYVVFALVSTRSDALRFAMLRGPHGSLFKYRGSPTPTLFK
ncbi:hypothetical protein SCHPADRAFT_960421 [Schizopora paradoxa]|uniref:Uncharacterized protein n=1 Tax=Schizopora paradoxa TaxID=27342 RepID=A0A0H2RX40_9AGAM|nr:hypothetical protein SCHPADRAFT_960421 [Schizopora paradoxa]